jgi:hypothetical protein
MCNICRGIAHEAARATLESAGRSITPATYKVGQYTHCAHCGETVHPPDSNYCNVCGWELFDIPEGEPREPDESLEPRRVQQSSSGRDPLHDTLYGPDPEGRRRLVESFSADDDLDDVDDEGPPGVGARLSRAISRADRQCAQLDAQVTQVQNLAREYRDATPGTRKYADRHTAEGAVLEAQRLARAGHARLSRLLKQWDDLLEWAHQEPGHEP